MYRAMQISKGKHSRLWEEQCKGPGAAGGSLLGMFQE